MLSTRLRLQRAARRLVTHGWPVTPGAPLRRDRFDCGRFGCHTSTCHPAGPAWQQATCWDRQAVHNWWRREAYSVLLPTGITFDVLDVPAPLGAVVVGRRASLAGPVAATPTGRWMFLVRPGAPLLPELAGRLDLVRHAGGSWVPAPPTRLAEGPIRWIISPVEVSWRLPDSREVQQRLAVSTVRAPTGG